MLERRLIQLEEAQRLAVCMGERADKCATCETAGHFYVYNVLAEWEKFLEKSDNWIDQIGDNPHKKDQKNAIVRKLFPFRDFFVKFKPTLFVSNYEEDMKTAKQCWTHIEWLFQEIKECRVFELLRHSKD